MKYCMDADGVGADPHCNVQVLIDGTALLAIPDEELENFQNEYAFNTVKIQLHLLGSVGKAIEVCKRAKALKLAVVVGGCCVGANSDGTFTPESSDTFVSDFSVGCGAGQLFCGGLSSAEFYGKYNRLLEIEAEAAGNISYVGAKFRNMN